MDALQQHRQQHKQRFQHIDSSITQNPLISSVLNDPRANSNAEKQTEAGMIAKSTAAVAAASSAFFGSIWTMGSSLAQLSTKEVAAYLPSMPGGEAPKLPQPGDNIRRLSIDSTSSQSSTASLSAGSVVAQSVSSIQLSADRVVDDGAAIKLADFQPYISAFGSDTHQLHEQPQIDQTAMATNPVHILIQQQHMPPIFFDENFDLSCQETFEAVFGAQDNIEQTAGVQLQRLSRHIDAIEEQLASEARKQSAGNMFVALSESNSTFEAMLQALPLVNEIRDHVRSLLEDFTDDSLLVTALYLRRRNLRKLLEHIARVKAVSEALGAVQLLIQNGSFELALDAIYDRGLSLDCEENEKLLFFEDALRRKESLLDSIESALERELVAKAITSDIEFFETSIQHPASALFRIQGRSRTITIQKLKAVLANGLKKALNEDLPPESASVSAILTVGHVWVSKAKIAATEFKQLIQQHRRYLSAFEQDMQSQLKNLIQEVCVALEAGVSSALASKSTVLASLPLEDFSQLCRDAIAQLDDLNQVVQPFGVNFDVITGQLQSLGQSWLKAFFVGQTQLIRDELLKDQWIALQDASQVQLAIDGLTGNSLETTQDRKCVAIAGTLFHTTTSSSCFITVVVNSCRLLNSQFQRIIPDLDICNRIVQLFVFFNERISKLILGTEALQIQPRVLERISPKVLLLCYEVLLCAKSFLPIVTEKMLEKSFASSSSTFSNRIADLTADLELHMKSIATKLADITEKLLIVTLVQRWQQQVRDALDTAQTLAELDKGVRSLRLQIQRALEHHPQHQKILISKIIQSLLAQLDAAIDVLNLAGSQKYASKIAADLKVLDEKIFSPFLPLVKDEIAISIAKLKQS